MLLKLEKIRIFMQDDRRLHLIRTSCCIFIAWLACDFLLKSGIFFDNYSWDPDNERTSRVGPDIEEARLGVALLVAAIIINPFYNLFKVRGDELDLETSTGLHEYYWLQAKGLVSKYGNDAVVKLALKESDDFLTDNQRKDFAKSRLAADLLLKVEELGEKYPANVCEQ